MKKNLPITQIEVPFTEGLVVTRTDRKGIITYANDHFIELSGFRRDELIGKSHNTVRHPEMPPVLFADLWDTVKRGECWRGYVKNRCKNGDYYWVDAFVVPVKVNGNIQEYMSVRTPASREAIREAEQLYPTLMQSKALPKPKKTGRTLTWFQPAYVSTMTLLLLAVGIMANNSLSYGIAISGIAASVTWWLLEHQRKQHQQKLLSACMNIAEGRLNNPLSIHYAGEQGHMETALAYMQVHLKVMLDELQMTSRQQAQETSDIQKTMDTIANRMSAGNDSVNQISASVEELSASVEQVSENARETARISAETSQQIASSNQNMSLSYSRTIAASQAVEETQGIIGNLTSAIDSITAVTQTIHDIADQTNLLALNAAIEAARAGETGRGFAVVADEVRKLAERTSLSTDEIKQLIQNVRQAADSTVSAIGTITEQTRAGAEAQQRTSEQLKAIEQSSTEVNLMMQTIANANSEQSATAAHLAERMTHIAQQFAESHQNINHTSQGVTSLANQAARLSEMANHFETDARRS